MNAIPTARIGAITYKLGIFNKYFYLSSHGEWLLASSQNEIKKLFSSNLTEVSATSIVYWERDGIQPKGKLKAAVSRSIITDAMKGAEPKTIREYAEELGMDKDNCKHRFRELRKSGLVISTGPKRCSINRRHYAGYILA